MEAGAEIAVGDRGPPRIDDRGRVAGVSPATAVDADLAWSPPAPPAPSPGCWAPSVTRTSHSGWPSAPTPRPPATPSATSRRASPAGRAGHPVPGYGWMFPAGDGTVNIGVGALSTMKGFKKLNLNTLHDTLPGPRAGRLGARPGPGTAPGVAAADEQRKRHGPGWVADRRRRRARQPDERRGHRLRPGVGHAGRRPVPRRPGDRPGRYDRTVGERFDAFLRTGRRFRFLIGHPLILKPGLRLAVGTEGIANITLRSWATWSTTRPRGRRQGHVARRQVPRPRRPDPAQDPRRRLIRPAPPSPRTETSWNSVAGRPDSAIFRMGQRPSDFRTGANSSSSRTAK